MVNALIAVAREFQPPPLRSKTVPAHAQERFKEGARFMMTSLHRRVTPILWVLGAGYGSLVIYATLAVLAVYSPVVAADADTLEEIVVTAQKREQNLQNVGVSVTALQSSDLKALGVVDTLQLGAVVAGLSLNSTTGGNYASTLTIRGVANSDYSPHQESPNSMYIDEVYVSAPNEQGAEMFDMQRVEVLRGPQGTLFGRNSTGGLVSFITNKPTSEDEGYVDVTYGEFNETRIEAAASGPLTDGIQGRLAVASQINDGYVRNYYPGQENLNGTDFHGVRGSLAFDLTDHLKALFSISYSHDNDREGFYGHIATYLDPNDNGRPAPLPPGIDAYGTGPGNDEQGYRSPYTGDQGSVSFVGFLHRGVVSPTLHVDWDLGGGTTLTSISNFTKFLVNYNEDCAGAPQFTCNDPYQQDLSQWSEEVRLAGVSGPLTWVTGAYGLGTSQEDAGEFLVPYYSGTPYAFSYQNTLQQHLTSAALFGQGEYLFTPNWRATLGLRVTHDDKDFSSQGYLYQAGNGLTDTYYNPALLIYNFSPTTVGGQAQEIDTFLTGKAQIDYILSDTALFYGSVSRGVKGAGFNSDESGAISLAHTRFGQETVYAYEIGEKLTLLDDRVTLDSGLFYYDYLGYQAYQYYNGPNPFVTNNNGRFEGGEAEIVARPMHGLDIHLGLSGISTVLYDVHTAQIGVVDQQATNAPKWSGNAMVRYAWAIGAGEASMQWSGDFYTGSYASVDNTPDVYIHGSSGQNVRVGYKQGHWDYSAHVNNVFNTVRQTSAYDLTSIGGYAVQTFMPPRWWGVTVHYKY
jgi:iron complex outermembrane receptor protein